MHPDRRKDEGARIPRKARALETVAREILGRVEEGNHERSTNELYEEIDRTNGPIWRPRVVLCIVIGGWN